MHLAGPLRVLPALLNTVQYCHELAQSLQRRCVVFEQHHQVATTDVTQHHFLKASNSKYITIKMPIVPTSVYSKYF